MNPFDLRLAALQEAIRLHLAASRRRRRRLFWKPRNDSPSFLMVNVLSAPVRPFH